jgi:hypothetical protein
MLLVNGVLAQDYPPCQTMGRQPGTNGASWQRGATVTVILNPTDFPPDSPQRTRIEDAFRVWQNANTNSGPSGSAQNGFLALAEFDKPQNGGNADGLFSIEDSGFSLLRLWSDKKRNGTSEPDELEMLSADLVIELKYHVMNKQDRNGNRLRYRSGKWVWDVIFARVNPFKRSKPV